MSKYLSVRPVHMHCPTKLHLTSMDGGNAIGL